MPTFIISPDFRVINKYLFLTEDFEADYPDYEIQPVENYLEWEVFNDEVAFTQAFKELISKYRLLEHTDNLLYLTLYSYDDAWQGIQHAYEDYQSKKRARELAQLLLLLKQTGSGKLINTKYSSLTDTVKTIDNLLNDWISKTIINAIEHKQFPIGAFGDTVLQMLDNGNPLAFEELNLDKLKTYANKRLINPKNTFNKAKATIALIVYSYLEGETKLRSAPGTDVSDKQLKFFFELLELLQMVSEEEVDSEPQDYMRTLINNYINK